MTTRRISGIVILAGAWPWSRPLGRGHHLGERGADTGLYRSKDGTLDEWRFGDADALPVGIGQVLERG